MRLQRAVDGVTRAIGGDRVAAINLRPYFAGGIETEEQFDRPSRVSVTSSPA